MSHNYPIKRHSFGGLTEQDKREAREVRMKGKLIFEVEDMPISEAFKVAERRGKECQEDD